MDRIEIISAFTHDRWQGIVDLGEGENDRKLERAFRMFNRISDEDAERLEDIDFNQPSMSAGDRVILNGDAFECEAIGFSPDERGEDLENVLPWPLSKVDSELKGDETDG